MADILHGAEGGEHALRQPRNERVWDGWKGCVTFHRRRAKARADEREEPT